jgi:hypothetical protein
VIARFPNTPYARDASLKLDLVRDHLAGKEMEVGRYYLQRDMYLAAINRFRTVVEQYQTTTHVPEALHRLVEAYLSLGINEEARPPARCSATTTRAPTGTRTPIICWPRAISSRRTPRRGPGCRAPTDGGAAGSCSRRSPSATSS